MESIIALEELIKENEEKATLQKRQLADHESGERKLSAMSEASTENSLEIANDLVAKYKSMLDKLLAQDAHELEEKEKLLLITRRKQYFDAQDSRIKLNKEKNNDQKLEVMRIIGELPTDVQFEDEELFEIATKSIELALPDLNELSTKLDTIKQDFQKLLKQSEEKDLQEIGTINFLIPIVILHFHVLLSNIKENIEEVNNEALQEKEEILKKREEKKEKLLNIITEQENRLKAKDNATPEDKSENSLTKNTEDTKEIKIESTEKKSSSEEPEEAHSTEAKDTPEEEVDIPEIRKQIERIDKEPVPEVIELKFSGFPRYQDWWIRELWLSHQAYFALFKWKSIITNLCITTEQKKAWSIIFDRWVFIKKLLNDKGLLAYNYNFSFDSILATYAEVEEELEKKNILSMELIIKEITKKEDFSTTTSFHSTDTPYLKFKKEKLSPKKEG